MAQGEIVALRANVRAGRKCLTESLNGPTMVVFALMLWGAETGRGGSGPEVDLKTYSFSKGEEGACVFCRQSQTIREDGPITYGSGGTTLELANVAIMGFLDSREAKKVIRG